MIKKLFLSILLLEIKFLNHTDIKTIMKYLNIDDDMEIIEYGL